MVLRLLFLVLRVQVALLFILALLVLAFLPRRVMHRISTAAFRELPPEAQLAYTIAMDMGLPAIQGIITSANDQAKRNHKSEMEYLSIIKGIAESNPELGAKLLTELQANGIKGLTSVLSTVFEGYDKLMHRFMTIVIAENGSPETLETYLRVNDQWTDYDCDQDIPF